MEIQQGMPTEDGRYVAFIADRVYKIWATPTIAVFHEGRWDIGRPVYAWIGPLPMGKIEDLWPTVFPPRFAEQIHDTINDGLEYDL